MTCTPDLERFKPIRCVFRKMADGTLEGLVEHSFSLGFSPDRVRIFWSGHAYSIFGEERVDGIADAAYNAAGHNDCIISDPLSEDCPVVIDWQLWLETNQSKFGKRNARFSTG